MKKVILILAACMLVFAFAGLASAETSIGDCLTCETDPGNIARGCESGTTGQYGTACATTPFDYEDFGECSEGLDSYCAYGTKGDIHRAMIKICDCIPDPFTDVLEDEIFDVGMTIFVDMKDGNGPVKGNNGVYWAAEVNNVGMQTFNSEGAACDEDDCTPENAFVGDFEYILANGTTTSALPYSGNSCDVDEDQEIVEFRAAAGQTGTHGYTITAADAISNNSVWWIDIPYLRADSNITQSGWDVYVEICIYESLDQGGVCGTCEGCCCLIKIGTLCCDDTPVVTTCSDTLIFPYLPKTTSYWYGMAVTNTSDEAGEASVTLYENDGDVATATITVPANTTMVISSDDLTTSGTLGDDKGYAVVVTDFSASGFAMMAKESNGVSMGYIAEKCAGCSCD